jgi:hypothetical protein
MVMKFTNNASSTLASGINNSVTSLTVATGQGALFPTLSAGDYFYCTLANAVGTVEIVKVTARSTDTFTITRAQDGTSAATWSTGDKVELRLVSASLNDLPKLDEVNTFSLRQTFSVGTVQGPWTTAGRPSSPTAGLMGFNTSFNRLEAYNGAASAWVSSGGATGTGSDAVFYENGKTVTASYTITSNNNAHSVGPITIASGQSVTIPTGSRWVIA